MFEHELGDKVRDIVTGYEGVIIARSEFLNGCIRYGVQRVMGRKDEKPQEAEWFDEKQLKVVKSKAVSIEPKRTGGPAAAPRMSANPK